MGEPSGGYDLSAMKAGKRLPYGGGQCGAARPTPCPDSPLRPETLVAAGSSEEREAPASPLLRREFSGRMRQTLHSTAEAAARDEGPSDTYRDLAETDYSSESAKWPFEFSYGVKPFPETSRCSMNF